MSALVGSWLERFLGRGRAAVTVPPLDGALKPNNRLEDAPRGLASHAPDNLVAQRFYKRYGFYRVGSAEGTRVPLDLLEKSIGY